MANTPVRPFEPPVQFVEPDTGRLTRRAENFLRDLFTFLGAANGQVPIQSLGGTGSDSNSFLADDGTFKQVVAGSSGSFLLSDSGIEETVYMGIPGLPGASGTTGAAGPAGPAIFVLEEAPDPEPSFPLRGDPGAAGATGAQGPLGPPVFLLEDGQDGSDGAPGPQGSIGNTGATGAQGPLGPPVFLLEDGQDGSDGAPGPQGIIGPTGATGAQGPLGPPVYLLDDGQDGQDGIPGPQGPQGIPAPIVYWAPEQNEEDWPMPTPDGPIGYLALTQHVLTAGFTILAGWAAYVPRYFEIAAGVMLEIGADGDLEIG